MAALTGDTNSLGFNSFPANSFGLPAAFNYEGSGWTTNGLTPGGFGFVTLIHELGHALGLNHPHDGTPLFPGVFSDADYGTYDLNQGIYTTMSYNSGWRSTRPSPSYDYGYELTPMALDIAAAQIMYGKNNSYHTGNDVYNLPKINATGTGWACIWDAGGTDTISANGASLACYIDLRAAALTGPTAGGIVSSVSGIYGGFTIANGVLIENIVGGNGNDTLNGNIFNNVINGGNGADTMQGFGGNDVYIVNVAGDRVIEAAAGGIDSVNSYLASYTLAANVENGNVFGAAPSTLIGNGLNNVFNGISR